MNHQSNLPDLILDLTIPGQTSTRELICMATLARGLLPGSVIVETGSLFGRSTFVWAKNAPTASVFAIDPFERAPWIIEWVEKPLKVERPFSKEAFLHYTQKAPNIRPIVGYSPSCVAEWATPLDVYFEDAVHENPGFSANIDFFLPFLKPGGIFCGHDFRWDYGDITRRVIDTANAWQTDFHVTEHFFWMRKPQELL
jgi:hypothetical protein